MDITKRFFAILLTLGVITAQSQDISSLIKKANFSPSMLKGEPVTTSFKDVKMEGSLPSTFGNDKQYIPLYRVKRNKDGGYPLCPGYYEMTNKSYCLRAGTHGPSSGDGYMYAPMIGKKANIIESILRNAESNQQINQKDIQVLLWAIIARTRFDDMNMNIKMTATRLLSPKEIVALNGGALGIISEDIMKQHLVSLPAPLQTIYAAENNIRNLASTGASTYEQFEKSAVLAGMAPSNNSNVTGGTWALHPDGYYIRYFPESYQKTKVQIYVPEKSSLYPVYNAIGQIACPANTGSQRLAQTNEPLGADPTQIGNMADPCGSKATNK